MYGEFKNDAYTVSLWHFNGNTDDETGDDDLTPIDSPVAAYGLFGGAYDYNGTSQYMIQLSFPGDDYFGTIEAIAKLVDGSTFVSAAHSGYTDRYLVFTRWYDQLGIQQDQGASAMSAVYGDDVIADGEWHYVAVTSSGSAWKLYVDGREQELTVDYGTNNGDWFADTSKDNLCIGALKRTSVENYIEGIIDSVRISDVERSAKEIREIWNKMKGVY